MKKLFLVFTLAAACYGAQAQMSDADQKAMMDHATPGEMHKMLASDAGEWGESIQMWMEPGKEPMTSEAEVNVDMIFDGRYQVAKHMGSMMGMRFEGISTTGYDNARGVFVNTWVDNFGTGIMYSEGKWNEKNRTIEFKGMCTDPVQKKQIPFRQVVYIIDEKNQRMEMFMTDKGKEFKSMEIAMKRKR